MSKITRVFIYILLLSLARAAVAQQKPRNAIDLSITYTELHANAPVNGCGCFWMAGGTGEIAIPLWRNFSAVAEANGEHAGHIPGSNVGLSLVNGLGGLRLRIPTRTLLQPYAEARGPVLVLTVAFCGGFGIWKHRTLNFVWRISFRYGVIPWCVLNGVYEIAALLIEDLLHIKPADSFYRVSGFKTSKFDPLQVTRRVLATFHTTMASNFIVIGINVSQSRKLFHQLQRSSVPPMTERVHIGCGHVPSYSHHIDQLARAFRATLKTCFLNHGSEKEGNLCSSSY
jgi:hypothetical protein